MGQLQTIYLVKVGLAVSRKTKGKYLNLWYEIKPDWNDGRRIPAKSERAYGGKDLFPGRPGTVISIQEDQDKPGTVYTDTAKYEGLWQNEEDVTEWQTKYDAVRLQRRAEKAMKEDVKRNFPKERLEPIRTVYRESGWERRALILAEVIRYITG